MLKISGFAKVRPYGKTRRAFAPRQTRRFTPQTTAAGAEKRPRGRPRKTLDERDDGNRRIELINAAARLFRKKGFNATSTRDIAAAVGMHSGSPFYHFKSKGALLYAVMEEGMRSALQRQAAALQAAGLPADDAPALLRLLVRSHFGVLLGPGSDFIPVMLYESRSITTRQRACWPSCKATTKPSGSPCCRPWRRQGSSRGR